MLIFDICRCWMEVAVRISSTIDSLFLFSCRDSLSEQYTSGIGVRLTSVGSTPLECGGFVMIQDGSEIKKRDKEEEEHMDVIRKYG